MGESSLRPAKYFSEQNQTDLYLKWIAREGGCQSIHFRPRMY